MLSFSEKAILKSMVNIGQDITMLRYMIANCQTDSPKSTIAFPQNMMDDEVMQSCKNVMTKCVVETTDKLLQSYIYQVEFDDRNIIVTWSDYFFDYIPLLKQMPEKLIGVKTAYTIDFYSLLQTYIDLSNTKDVVNVDVEIAKLREECGCLDKYANFSQFKVKVMNIALEELQDSIGTTISYTYLKKGKENHAIRFAIGETY